MSQFVKCLAIIFVAISFCLPVGVLAQANIESKGLGIKGAVIKAAELGETRNVHQLGNLYFAGTPDRNIAVILKSKKIKRVISLCTDGEIKWDEKSSLENAGIEFVQIGIGSLDDMNVEFYAKIRTLLKQDDIPTLFHCASATRVGAAWLPYRVLDQGVDVEIAKVEAEIIGLRSKVFVERAVSYIQQQQAETQDEKSVKPGINDNFKNPELDVDDFVKRFEIESREIYSSRKQLVEVCNLQAGQRVADVGAGTGLFTRQFSEVVGKEGWVYAVDISPRFIEHINADAKEHGMNNITGVLCADNSVNLPPESVDVVFICDTYHHFEYPKSTMASIHKALKPGGRLVVIDFERIPGKSREWLLGHVRAGKEVFRAEIIKAGFKFSEEVTVTGLEENYCLVFKK